MKEAFDQLVKVYGPFAFGLITLLVVWLSIIGPELDRKGLDFDMQRDLMTRHEAMLERQNNLAKAFEFTQIQQTQTIEALKSTAEILDKVTERLQAMKDSE